jgi:hypothetical protein
MPKPLTIQERLDRFPPVACRILARAPKPSGGVRALTDAEIAAGSGRLSVKDVARLSRLTAWDTVPIADAFAFLKGCGVQIDDRDWMRKNVAYLQELRGAPRYLKQSDEWETLYKPLLILWTRSTQQG